MLLFKIMHDYDCSIPHTLFFFKGDYISFIDYIGLILIKEKQREL